MKPIKMPKLPAMPKIKPVRLPGQKAPPPPDPNETVQSFTDGEVKRADEAFDKLKADIKAEQRRFEIVNDSEYWVALCFESREHKEEFLRLFELAHLGDKYLNGHHVAQRLGKPLQTPRVVWPNHRENKNWKKFR